MPHLTIAHSVNQDVACTGPTKALNDCYRGSGKGEAMLYGLMSKRKKINVGALLQASLEKNKSNEHHSILCTDVAAKDLSA